jgi:hypothetical protein
MENIQKFKILFVGCMLTATLNAQKVNKEQSTIHQTVESMFATLSSDDTTALKTFVTTNVRFYEYGQVWPIDTLIQDVIQIKSIKDFKRTNRFDFVSTTIHKQTAWVTYYLESIITADGKLDTLNWLETVVLVKQKGKWKIDVLHSTRLSKN